MEQSVINIAYEWSKNLNRFVGRTEDEAENFWEELCSNEQLLEEFIFYMNNRQFLGSYEIEGMTIVDVLVWQMDHFKADLDKGMYDMQSNPDVMILSAFETMIRMYHNPDEFISRFKQDTGTDYPGKY